MDIDKLRSTTPISNAQRISTPSQPPSSSPKPKPILDGGLSVTMAKRNVLEELQRVEDVEEPSLDDSLGSAVKDVFALPPPDMPNFV